MAVTPVKEQEADDDADDMTGAPPWAKTLYKYMTKLDSVVNGGDNHDTEQRTPENKPKSKHWLFGE